jgi:predicted transcriptional regulator
MPAKSIRYRVARRQRQHDFIERGLAAAEEARASSKYVAADVVINRLERMLADAKGRK